MSKDELNNPISNSETENTSGDSALNTQQIVKSDLIQENGENNQFSNGTDDKISNRPPGVNQDSNLISEDLENVNKQEDSGSINENSVSNIKDSANSNTSNNQTVSPIYSESNLVEDKNCAESLTAVSDSNEGKKEVDISADTQIKSESQSEKETEDPSENNVSASGKSGADNEVCDNEIITTERENIGDYKERKVVEICSDSGPHFSRSNEVGASDDEKSDPKKEANEIRDLKSESDATQEHLESNTEPHEGNNETKEQINEADIVNVSDQQESKTEDDTVEAETYEDDFEDDQKEDDQKDIVKVSRQENSDNTTDENNSEEIVGKSERQQNSDEDIAGLNTDVDNKLNSEKVIDEDKNHEETNDRESVNCDTSRSVNEEREEKELTEIVINEEGIPKVSITTVPDRPPSSQASEVDKPDPFEDFPEESETTSETYSTKESSEAPKDKDKADPFEDFPDDKGDNSSNKNDSNTNQKSPFDKQRDGEKVESGNIMESSEEVTIHDEKKECADDAQKEDNKSETEDSESQNAQHTERGLVNEAEKSDNVATDIKTDEVVEDKNSENSEGDNSGKNESKSEQTNESNSKTEINNDEIPKVDNDDITKSDKDNTSKVETAKVEERSKSPVPEPLPAIKQETPLERILKRNVTIDGTVDSVTELESNVITLLASMKDVMTHYSDLLKLQAMKDFTSDLGKFKGDFTSINEAFKRCNAMSLNINQHLKELRHTTDDVRKQIHRKFQQEDLSTWIDNAPEKEKEKERLQEEAVAAERAAMAKAAEARHAVSTAITGVAEAHQLIAEMETQAADAEAISQKAASQARAALLAAEEARVAAEERKRVEEASKKRAEERARIKAAEEEKKKALEEMKIHQDAAAKGTSVEDERRSFMEEKKHKELERKNPKNWPRYSFTADGVDFKPAIGCIIRAIDGSMRKADVTCSYVDQSKGVLKLTSTEELVSNIIAAKQVEEDRTFSFEEPLSVALPVCIGRIPSGKETVVKQLMPNGAWKELPSADVQFEDYRELKFVEGRCSKFGTFAVVLRPKKDTLQFQKKGSKLLCSSDSRISFTNKPGTFKQNVNAVLEVQTLDTNAISDLKMRSPKECEDLVSASPFIKFSLLVKSLEKPLTVSLPLPQVQTRQKRPATGITRETKSQDLRPATARPSATTEDDATEAIFFLHRDEKTCWTVNTKMHLVQPKSKDTATFDIAHPYQRMILLRTKAGKSVVAVEKMANLLENITTQRNVKIVARQRNDDVAEVIVACTSANRTERTLKYLEDRSFTEGPNPSPDVVLQEGQQLYMRFRGNVECVSQNPSLSFIYNTNIRATREFRINEKEEFAQKSLPSFRGFVQVFTKALVPKPVAEDAPKNVQPEMVEAEILLTELLLELPKPEAEPPKPLATAPLHLKEGPLTNGVLRFIAGMMGKEWKEVAAQLNLKPMRIQAILRNHLNKDTAETRFDMLVTWAKRVPKAVDKVQILYNALVACGRPDIAEEVRHRGQQYKQQRFMSARVSHLRQAFVKVAKTTTVFNHWKAFAKKLGVPDDKIKHIDEAGGSGQEKCYTSLETWKDTAGEEATVTSLASYLKTAKQDRLSRDVESLVAS